MSNKRLAEGLVAQFEKNPRLALLLVPLGAWLAYSGISDARADLTLKNKPTQLIKVDRVYQGPNHRGFTVDFVAGKANDFEANFPVSQKRAERIQVGDMMGVVETGDPNFPFKIREEVEEHLSNIQFSAGDVPFNHIAIFGAVIALLGIGWAVFGKPKNASSTQSPAIETAGETTVKQ